MQDIAAQVVKDGYAGLKMMIQRRYSDVSLEALEKKPDFQDKKDSVAEGLVDAGAGRDEELLLQAQTLVKLVDQDAPDTAAAVNVKLSDVKAIGSVRIADLRAASGAVTVDLKKVEADGDVEVTGLTAGEPEGSNRKNARPQ